MENKLFISDNDAAQISWMVADYVIRMKSYITKIIFQQIYLAKLLRKMSSLDNEKALDVVCDLAKNIIFYSRLISPLNRHAEIYRKSNILELTCKIMVGKK